MIAGKANMAALVVAADARSNWRRFMGHPLSVGWYGQRPEERGRLRQVGDGVFELTRAPVAGRAGMKKAPQAQGHLGAVVARISRPFTSRGILMYPYSPTC